MIAPKTRYGPKSTNTEKHDIGEASSSSSSQKPRPLSPEVQKATKQLLRLLPESYKLTTLPKEKELVALIEPSHYLLLSQAFPSTRVLVKVKTCPSLSHSGIASSDAPASPEKGKGKDVTEEDQVLEALVYLKPDSCVPPSAIYLSTSARKSLNLSGKAFELLQISAVTRQEDRERHEEQESSVTAEQHPDVDASLETPQLAGFEKHSAKALKFIEQAIASSKIISSSSSTAGMLICGGAGSGKTSLIEQIAQQTQDHPAILARTQYVKCAQLVNLRIPQLKARLEEEFTAAAWYAPALIIFDDLDHLIPAEVEHIDSFRSLHIANLFTSIATKASRNNGIVLLATAKAPESLHAQLAQSHFFSERIILIAPDKDARKAILTTVARAKMATSPDLIFTEDLNFASIAAQTDGYLPVDLRDLVDRALHQAAIRAGKSGRVTLELSPADVRAAQADFTPLSLRDVKLQKSEVEWGDIGGLQETRRVLRETLEWPTKYGAIFASSPLRLRSG